MIDEVTRQKILAGDSIGRGMHIIQSLTEAHGWKFILEPKLETEFRLIIPKL